jgi:hypothetical protein
MLSPAKPPTLERKFLRFFGYYFGATLTYGFARAMTYEYENSREYYNRTTCNYETKRTLLMDQVQTVAGKTLFAFSAWPAMLVSDLRRLECFVRGRDPSEYGR